MKAEAQTIVGQPLMDEAVLPVISKLNEVLLLLINNKDEISEALSPIAEFLGNLALNSIGLLQGALEWVVSNEKNLKGTFQALSDFVLVIGLYTHPVLTTLALVVAKWDEITSAIDNAIISAERFFGINSGSGVHTGSSGNSHGGGSGSFGNEGGSFSSGGGGSFSSGGTGGGGFWGFPEAKGLDFVPFDEFPAILHKGEAVLNASQAAVWRGGNMGNLEAKMDSMINMLGQILNVNGRMASNFGSGYNVVLDSGALVGNLLPQIDQGLGKCVERSIRRI
jgi:hypothetical protein